MPSAPPRPCVVPGCPHTTPPGCPDHPRTRTGGGKGYDHRWAKRSRRYRKQHPTCAWCGKPSVLVDHIVSRRRGGSDDDANLQALCARCHGIKTASDGTYDLRRARTHARHTP